MNIKLLISLIWLLSIFIASLWAYNYGLKAERIKVNNQVLLQTNEKIKFVNTQEKFKQDLYIQKESVITKIIYKYRDIKVESTCIGGISPQFYKQLLEAAKP